MQTTMRIRMMESGNIYVPYRLAAMDIRNEKQRQRRDARRAMHVADCEDAAIYDRPDVAGGESHARYVQFQAHKIGVQIRN